MTIAETIQQAGLPEWTAPIVAASTLDPTFLERRVTVENLTGIATAAVVETMQLGLRRYEGLAARHKLDSYLPAVLGDWMSAAPNAIPQESRLAVAQALVTDAQAELGAVASELSTIIATQYAVAFPE